MKLKVVMGVIVIFCFLGSVVFAQQDRLRQLEEKIKHQQQVLQELESKVKQQENDTRDYTVACPYSTRFRR